MDPFTVELVQTRANLTITAVLAATCAVGFAMAWWRSVRVIRRLESLPEGCDLASMIAEDVSEIRAGIASIQSHLEESAKG